MPPPATVPIPAPPPSIAWPLARQTDRHAATGTPSHTPSATPSSDRQKEPLFEKIGMVFVSKKCNLIFFNMAKSRNFSIFLLKQGFNADNALKDNVWMMRDRSK
jgi:hypothetical protein